MGLERVCRKQAAPLALEARLAFCSTSSALAAGSQAFSQLSASSQTGSAHQRPDLARGLVLLPLQDSETKVAQRDGCRGRAALACPACGLGLVSCADPRLMTRRHDTRAFSCDGRAPPRQFLCVDTPEGLHGAPR